MTNFREMARKAQAAYEAKKAERDAEEAYERQARSKSVDQGIDLLNQQVMPLLEQAKNDFGAERIEAHIERDFDVLNYAGKRPTVYFKLKGPRRSRDNYQFETRSAFFESDGKIIFIGLRTGNQADDRVEAQPGGHCGRLVSKTIEQLLEDYFEQLRIHQESGTL